ncbi:MAG: 4Fe-4S binding protein [Methanohalobium sp.]|uniref:4Fe-4S binding protein n=1 Tax=Methanohalobium sp. TaxID=2837493 RepID=UPI00397AC98A
MLKITPYMGIIVLIVATVGLWYPILGYFMVVMLATLMIISPFRGRWFCGNICPRGSLYDFWVGKITKSKKIPKILESMWVRVPVFAAMMGFMGYRIFEVIQTESFVNQLGMVFVSMCFVSTSVAVVLGVFVSPRTWCTICPMGTVQRIIGGDKYQLQVDDDKCISCNKCSKVCPMHLDVKNVSNNPDCIKCERCVDNCPKDALNFPH